MEIMYFKAESDDERKQWIETLRIGITLDNYNIMIIIV